MSLQQKVEEAEREKEELVKNMAVLQQEKEQLEAEKETLQKQYEQEKETCAQLRRENQVSRKSCLMAFSKLQITMSLYFNLATHAEIIHSYD